MTGVKPFSDATLLGNCHRLLERVIPHWLSLRAMGAPKYVAPDGVDSDTGDEEDPREVSTSDREPGDIVAAPVDPVAPNSSDWSAFNAKQRMDTKAFAKSSPGVPLLIAGRARAAR